MRGASAVPGDVDRRPAGPDPVPSAHAPSRDGPVPPTAVPRTDGPADPVRRSAGNAGVQRLLGDPGGRQHRAGHAQWNWPPRNTTPHDAGAVSSPGDPAEREADLIADEVLRASAEPPGTGTVPGP